MTNPAQYCRPLPAGTRALSPEQIATGLASLPGWTYIDGSIVKTFRFIGYRDTIAFVNKVAALAQEEDHHPQLQVDYDCCRVAYNTHSIGGISENDFICAHKIDAL